MKVPDLPPGKKIANTTSLIVTHLTCGYQRVNGTTLQKARAKNFKICPKCDGVDERKYEWSWQELAKATNELIGAVLTTPEDNSRYARKSATAPELKTEIDVQCNKCGHPRHITMKQLLKLRDNGCPRCAGNTPHDTGTLIARALEYGLKIVNPQDYRGGSTKLTYQCALCEGTFERIAQNQRKRSCGACYSNKRAFGEMLLQALCRHYFPRVKWIPNYKVVGLVPAEPTTPVYYDLGCPDLKIVLENHSEYHVADEFGFNGTSISGTLPRRKMLDAAKIEAVVSQRSVFTGWCYGEVWLELAVVSALPVDSTGSYIPAVVEKFKEVMLKCGQDISAMSPPTSADLFRHFSTYIAFPKEALVRGFDMQTQDWKGRSSTYQLLHSCGQKTTATPAETETRWRNKQTGCDWCDESGRLGNWKSFVNLVATRGWRVQQHTQPRREIESVEFICEHHPQEGVQVALRKDLREECRDAIALLPTCRGCRKAIEDRAAVEYRKGKVTEVLKPFDDELRRHGQMLDEWKWKGTAHADGSQSRYQVKCLRCKQTRKLVVHTTVNKLRKSVAPKIGCPGCVAAAKFKPRFLLFLEQRGNPDVLQRISHNAPPLPTAPNELEHLLKEAGASVRLRAFAKICGLAEFVRSLM